MRHRSVAFTFTITDVVTEVNGSLRVIKLMATIQKAKPSFSTMVASGTVVSSVFRGPNKETKWCVLTKKNKEITRDNAYQNTLQRSAVIRFMGCKLPVIGFNSGRYDLQLIGKYFITHLGQEDEVLSGEKQGQIMYMDTPQFKFLDIRNYLSPGITYDKWFKTYGAKQTKSWLPYQWFDSADKLDYKGLLPILVLVFTTKK